MNALSGTEPAALQGNHGVDAAPFLSAHGISHAYRRGQPVLSDVALDVPRGAVVALVGRSGCGKSTLLHILSGLTTPKAGGVRIGGQRVTGPSPAWVVMFQSPSLFPWMTVWQNAELGLRFGGRRNTAKMRIPQVLELVELSPFAERNVQDLSGGQQQRVALARSLAPEPDILFLDEPFSALDAFTRRGLQRDVRRIAREMRLTVVLVTHDVSEAVAMADRTVLFQSDPGRVAADTTIALAEDERHEGGPAFAAELARIERLYAEIAGQAAPLTHEPT
ncbi:MAG: ABC transporter ATP-binding protein [Pseudomonadota bacterium]